MNSSLNTLGKKKILVVDDDESFLDEIKEALSLNGYEVSVFLNCESALEKSGTIKPDLILLDLKMPVKSGFELVDELRQMPNTANTPIIVLTGHYTEEELELFIRICRLGDFLIKPFDCTELVSRIDAALKRKKAR
jgi:DNA-binding response OmpR family regulator